nr:MAG TPA: hypothetical protein [Caudoviricetes sp.]
MATVSFWHKKPSRSWVVTFVMYTNSIMLSIDRKRREI